MTGAYLACRDLSRHFGALVALDRVSMAVEQGEIRAIIGPNGAGKSTFFNVLTGVLPATGGTVTFRGVPLSGLPAHEVCRRGISRTFQLTALFPRLSALENVRIAAQARHPRRWRPVPVAADRRQTLAAAEEWIARVGLAHASGVPAGLLAHGDQRLLEIAMALAQRPEVLLLDEPTQGLSVEETERTVQILRTLLGEGGLTVLLVEHDMDVVFSLARSITVLHHGRVIADGSPDEVKRMEAVQSAYLGGLE